MHIANPIRFFEVEFYRAKSSVAHIEQAWRHKEHGLVFSKQGLRVRRAVCLCLGILIILLLYMALMVIAGFGIPTS